MLNLFKWQLVGLTRYNLVLFTDADVDMMTDETDPDRNATRTIRTHGRRGSAPGLTFDSRERNLRVSCRLPGEAVVRARWLAMVPAILRPRDHGGGHASHGGEALANETWAIASADYTSPVHGGYILMRTSAWLHAEGLQVLNAGRFNYTHGFEGKGAPNSYGVKPRHIDGAPANDVGAGNEPQHTSATTRNAWDFVNAFSDQGFFWCIPPP